MAGILEMFNDPATQGILSLSSNLLRAGGPSATPVPFGAALGNAFHGFQQDQRQQQMLDMQKGQLGLQQQLGNLTLAQHAQSLRHAQQQEQALNAFANTLPPDQQTLFKANPAAYIAELNKKYVVGDSLVSGNGQSAFTAAPKPTLQDIPVAGQPGVSQPTWLLPGQASGVAVGGQKMPEILNPAVQKARLEVAAAGKPSMSTQVTMKQEGEEAKTVGKFFGENYADIQKAGFNAPSKIARADRLNQLLENVDTGKLTPAGTELAAYAESAGFKIDKNLGNKQAAQALANEMALELRNPAGGAGMPGALSDSDRNFLTSMTPGLSTSPEGRKQITETMQKMAKRDQEVAKLARDYRTKNGSIDEGFYNQMRAYSDSHPLFSKTESTPDAIPAGAVRRIR